jgi:hypothetical protein
MKKLVYSLLAVSLALFFYSCAPAAEGEVAAPTFSVAGGNYAVPQTVSISTTTAGATINYTTNGDIPSSSVGTLYAAPIDVQINQTIRAIAFMSDWADSAVAQAVYVINPSGELLDNHSFESGTMGWTGGTSTLAAVTNPAPQDGANAVHVTGRTASWQTATQDATDVFNLYGPGQYAIYGYVYEPNTPSAGAGFGTGGFVTVNISGADNAQYHPFMAQNTWTQVGGTLSLAWSGTLSAGAVHVYSGTVREDGVYSDGTGDCYIDNISVKYLGP